MQGPVIRAKHHKYQSRDEESMTDAIAHRKIGNPSITILTCVFCVAALLCLSTPGVAEELDLTGMSIEALMDVKVTSVTKKVQHLSDRAAAIFA